MGYSKSNKKKKDEYNYKQIAFLGKSFYDAAIRCSEEPKLDTLGLFHPMLAPIVTNLAFSCELLLKANLLKFGKVKRGHRLVDLFNELPGHIKKDIFGSENQEEFIARLTNVSDFFEEWRYIYEYWQPKSIQYGFIRKLSESLYEIVMK